MNRLFDIAREILSEYYFDNPSVPEVDTDDMDNKVDAVDKLVGDLDDLEVLERVLILYKDGMGKEEKDVKKIIIKTGQNWDCGRLSSKGSYEDYLAKEICKHFGYESIEGKHMKLHKEIFYKRNIR